MVLLRSSVKYACGERQEVNRVDLPGWATMHLSWKSYVKRLVHRFGYDVVRWVPNTQATKNICKLLGQYHVDMVLDVGANIGEYASDLRRAGYRGQIISFEPLSVAHEVLVHRSRNDRLWIAAPRTAIGDINGAATINVSRILVSSSLLNMAPLHQQLTPSAVYCGTEVVPLSRLDTVGRNYVNAASVVFLKVDTQGFEWNVVEGARGILSNVIGMQLELSVSALYENQILLDEMLQLMRDKGFRLHGFIPGLRDVKSGLLLQVDGIFVRRSATSQSWKITGAIDWS